MSVSFGNGSGDLCDNGRAGDELLIVLVGGGSRSGKSRFALSRARQEGAPLAFVATAQALDEEMEERIARHKDERGPEFVSTVEEPLELAAAIRQVGSTHRGVVVDCLTLWTSNLMLARRDAEQEWPAVEAAAEAASGTVLFVTNEVGCGLVPESELGRRFRDVAGRINQAAAAAAAEVWWTAFGIPVRLR